VAKEVRVGAYRLTEEQTRMLKVDQDLEVEVDSATMEHYVEEIRKHQEEIGGEVDAEKIRKWVHVGRCGVRIARSNKQEEGDVKVTQRCLKTETAVSIIAQVKGDTFVPYQTRNTSAHGAVMEILNGKYTKDEMLRKLSDVSSLGVVWRTLRLVLLYLALRIVAWGIGLGPGDKRGTIASAVVAVLLMDWVIIKCSGVVGVVVRVECLVPIVVLVLVAMKLWKMHVETQARTAKGTSTGGSQSGAKK
jgi:hypothetical protein